MHAIYIAAIEQWLIYDCTLTHSLGQVRAIKLTVTILFYITTCEQRTLVVIVQ